MCVSLTLLLSMFVLQNLTNQSSAVWQKSSKSSQTISLFGSEGSVDGNDWQRHLVCIHQSSFINSANSKSEEIHKPIYWKISGFKNNN